MIFLIDILKITIIAALVISVTIVLIPFFALMAVIVGLIVGIDCVMGGY